MVTAETFFHNSVRWGRVERAYVREYASNVTGKLQSISDSTSAASMCEALRETTGFFAAVYRSERRLVAVVDRIRSMPLFFGTRENTVFISDVADWVRERVGGSKWDPLAAKEMAVTGYVTGPNTLYPGVKQLQAGELLVVDLTNSAAEPEVHRYYRYLPGKPRNVGIEQYRAMFDQTLGTVFNRLVEWAAGRPLVVPLSGGFDSRLVATMLKRLDYPNIITFSYGKPGNPEATVSQRVAKLLGLKWEFVSYDVNFWRDWSRGTEKADYYKFSNTLSAISHIQDCPAVAVLKRRGVIPDGSIFVPGHSADLLAGSRSTTRPRVYAGEVLGVRELAAELVDYHYSLWDWSHEHKTLRPLFEDRVRSYISQLPCDTVEQAVAAFESWDYAERQTKFIVNSIRAYEFLGYDWWLPFWEKEFMEFWSHVPLSHRINKTFYDTFVTVLFNSVTGQSVTATPGYGTHQMKNQVREVTRQILQVTGVLSSYRRLRRYLSRLSAYDSDAFGWYGLVELDRFRRLYTGRENINSFLVLDRMGIESPKQVGLKGP